jgi:thiosulfate dehydrogenase [quinone] large subunit
MDNPVARKGVAAIAALIGGYLLYVAANPQSSAGTALVSFAVGLVLWVGIAAVLVQFYRPGRDEPSEDEVTAAPEWKVARFLSRAKEAAPLYLGIRLFLGWEWLEAGWHKLTDPAWFQTGQALRSYWERAVVVPQQGRPPITYPAYRAFIQYMLDHNWHTWFNQVIIWGEILVGLGLLVGGLTAIAATFALLMNFSFMFAGTVSSNPTMIILEALIIYGWRVSGWWGLDHILLPLLGTPWGKGQQRRQPTGGAGTPVAASTT